MGLNGYNFKPYSIRRGGATAFYRRTKRMDETLERGRWASYRVARIYVNDGLAKELELTFCTDLTLRLNTMANALTIRLRQK